MKFRLKTGQHVDLRGKDAKHPRVFKKGDIVTATGDLTKAFPQKFERVASTPEEDEQDEKQAALAKEAEAPAEQTEDAGETENGAEKETPAPRRRGRPSHRL